MDILDIDIWFLQRPYDGTQLLYPLMSFTIVMQAYLQVKKLSIGNESE